MLQKTEFDNLYVDPSSGAIVSTDVEALRLRRAQRDRSQRIEGYEERIQHLESRLSIMESVVAQLSERLK